MQPSEFRKRFTADIPQEVKDQIRIDVQPRDLMLIFVAGHLHGLGHFTSNPHAISTLIEHFKIDTERLEEILSELTETSQWVSAVIAEHEVTL